MFTINLSKTLSLFLSLALLTSSMPVSAAPVASAPMPDFVKALTPSENLGFVDSYYKGNTERPVVLIQDLHANYGVQKKIRGLLEFFQPKVAPTGRPMVIGMEGAWGDVNTAEVRNQPEKPRRATADFLLSQAEISAMEHFAVLSEAPVKLVGVDDPEDYIVHTELFKKSLLSRMALAKKTDQLRMAVNESRTGAPSGLRQIWKLEEELHAGEIDLVTLSRKLDMKVSNYKEAEEALARAKAAEVKEQKGDKAFFLNNVVEADQNLSLLGRLLRQQLTLEEVQYAHKRIPAMLMTIRALLPGENMALWNDTIQAAIDHYAIALLRDKPMGEHAWNLAQKNTDTSVVVVAGGFHTAGIANYLKARKASYVVIAPIVESHTLKDEELYAKRMMDIHVTDTEIAASAKSLRSSNTVAIRNAVVFMGQAMYGPISRVWGKTFASFNRNAPVTSDTLEDQSNTVAALESVLPEESLGPQSLNLRTRVRNAWSRWTGRVRNYTMPNTQGDNSVTVGENIVSQVQSNEPATRRGATGLGIGRPGATGAATAAILLGVALTSLANTAVEVASKTGESGDVSQAFWVAAGVGVTTIVGMAVKPVKERINIAKQNKEAEKLRQRMKDGMSLIAA